MTLGKGRLSIDVNFQTVFVATYVVAFLLSKYLGFFNGYAVDDYSITAAPESAAFASQFLSQGRFSFAALQLILSYANVSMINFHAIALVGISLFSGLLYSVILDINNGGDNKGFALVASAMLGTYPYFSEYVSFRQAALPMALMFLFLWLSFKCLIAWGQTKQQRVNCIFVSILFATIAIGFNQLALSFYCIGLLYVLTKRYLYSHGPNKLKWWHPYALTFAGGIILSLTYFIVAYIIRVSFNVPTNDRAVFINFSHIPDRILQVLKLTQKILISNEPIATGMPKLALLAGMATLLIQRALTKPAISLQTLVFFILALGLAILPDSVSAIWWAVPRTLIAIPVVFAGTILLLQNNLMTWPSKTGLAAITLATILFSANSTAVLTNQLRINRWDMATARGIWTVVSQTIPDKVDSIVLNHPHWAYPVAPNAAEGDLNVSALSIDWAVKPLFREATGRDINVHNSTSFDAQCAGKGIFPAKTSVFRQGTVVVVCM